MTEWIDPCTLLEEKPRQHATYKHVAARLAGLAAGWNTLLTDQYRSFLPERDKWIPSIYLLEEAMEAFAPQEMETRQHLDDIQAYVYRSRTTIVDMRGKSDKQAFLEGLGHMSLLEKHARKWAQRQSTEIVQYSPTLLEHEALTVRADPFLHNLALNKPMNPLDKELACHQLHIYAGIAHAMYPLQDDDYTLLASESLNIADANTNPLGSMVNIYRTSFDKLLSVSAALEN